MSEFVFEDALYLFAIPLVLTIGTNPSTPAGFATSIDATMI
jgi:hypothetical protein